MVEHKSEQQDFSEDQRRDQLLAEVLMRISSLEKLLITKGLVSEQELAEGFNSTARALAAALSSSNQLELDK